MIKKHNVQEKYNLPSEVRFCKKCVISNQRPRIKFDSNGVCNACNYAERKKSEIDWKLREEELWGLLSKYRRSDGKFDVIVPSSGGKDSVFVAHQLKFKYDMNPLTVTWAPHIYTDIGWKNFQAQIHAGLPNILGTPDGQVHRRLTKDCLIEMGEPFQPFIYGQVSFPLQMALAYDIPLIMDGENGEVEYGGDDSSNEKGFTLEDEIKYWFSSFPIDYWLEKGYTRKELNIYFPPDIEKVVKAKINRQFFSYYHNWDPQENYYYASENTCFKANPDGRSEGTYSKYASLDDKIDGFHYYLMFAKFGICRATSDAAHEIREGHLTREEGISLVRKFDGEFPKKYFQDFLDYCDITEDVFWNIVDSWRAEHLWKKEGDNWKIKEQIK